MSVQSIDRAFSILELLSSFPKGLPLSEIVLRTSLNKTTVHRILSSMKERSYIEQDSESGYYKLGVALIALAGSYFNQLDLKNVAEPVMRRLSDTLGVTLYLAVLRDGEAVYLDKVERFDGFRRFDIIGRHVPVHCTSLGKALIMEMDKKDVLKILEYKPPVKKTEKTITDAEKILENLDTCRKRGWSSDLEEHEKGVTCAGAPIKDYKGRTVAAISAVWKSAFPPGKIEDVGKIVSEGAKEISYKLGFDHS